MCPHDAYREAELCGLCMSPPDEGSKVSDGEAGKSTGPGTENGGPTIVDGSTDCARRPPAFDLEASRARCEAAVPGPWEAKGYSVYDGADRIITACWRPWGPVIGVRSIKADAALIAHARTDLPAALDEIDSLSRRNAMLGRLLAAHGPYLLGRWTEEVRHVEPCDCDEDEGNTGPNCMDNSDWTYAVLADGSFTTLVRKLPRHLPDEDYVDEMARLTAERDRLQELVDEGQAAYDELLVHLSDLEREMLGQDIP